MVYSFTDLVKYQKIELLARQLTDFKLSSLKFIAGTQILIGAGKENIRIFKLKNNYLPSQLISLNNTARGKEFNNSCAGVFEGKKLQNFYVTTECGLLYFINNVTRKVDKILQLHDGSISAIFMTKKFALTASRGGSVKLWGLDFGRLISEVQINQTIRSVDVNVHETEISVLSDDGALSVLELDTSSFSMVMRSH